MNYLRGAVSAISVPYQYYKDLNPSTLTGAIDVIVIQRPSPDGGTELVCSPFHVRFGKWQVLRPFEKKVTVLVNGNPIPFDMKIGEAGEAFFVFETDDDVPSDLITSPILQPTIPDAEAKDVPSDTERFAAPEEPQKPDHPDNTSPPQPVEPEQFDLDGPSTDAHDEHIVEEVKSTPRQTHFVPNSLRKSGSRATISPRDLLALPSPPPSRDQSLERSRTPEMDEQDKRADAVLQGIAGDAHMPEVEYHNDVTLDMEGYKQGYHERERSDKTIRTSPTSNDSLQPIPFPSFARSSALSEAQTTVHSPAAPSSSTSRSPSPGPNSAPSDPARSYPNYFRATSEPPPELDSHADPQLDTLPPLPASTSQLKLSVPQEYSWEWGGFPQPSPLKPTFGKGGRLETPTTHKGKSLRYEEPQQDGDDDDRVGRSTTVKRMHEVPPINTSQPPASATDGLQTPMTARNSAFHGRSRSVPPLLEATLDHTADNRDYKEYEDLLFIYSEGDGEHLAGADDGNSPQESEDRTNVFLFGEGGLLTASEHDNTIFNLAVDSQQTSFQLSIIPSEGDEPSGLFNNYLVSFDRFMGDDTLLDDPRLVIRWTDNQYITRTTGQAFLDALERWRNHTLQQKSLSKETLRDDQQRTHLRSRSEPPTPAELRRAEEEDKEESTSATLQASAEAPRKPTSSLSWVQWWSRSRRNDVSGQPPLDVKKDTSTASLPLPAESPHPEVKSQDHVPTAPSTPVQRPVDAETTPTKGTAATAAAPPAKKYAKTLRLTSDQLKSLELKAGANSITFSLSATGAIAATARIFLWEYTDHVVISDIDGTITKSDGLGHVFAMIGRDWTHTGVAKLYTDIVKNGYKIMYLTSRAIGQADSTRYYLRGIKQNDYRLPEGPVIMSPDRLMASLHREVIMRKPEVFKMACLRDIQRLFGESARNPFYAGFGNRITDALSYRSVNVPSARIFTIDSAGEVKMELLELAGYKSSYIHMTDLVDQMFPPVHKKEAPEFNDFNYWKPPMQDFPLPDLSPPSPALSARSDTSNQSTLARLRNFSLGGNSANASRATFQQSTSKALNGVAQDNTNGSAADGYRSSHLRQMSSFERLSSTLGFLSASPPKDDYSRRSVSPVSSSRSSYASDDEDEESDANGRPVGRGRSRRRSMTSMPGTLDESHFDMDDEEDHFVPSGSSKGEGEDEEDVHLDEEPDIDDEIMALAEMKDVPYF